MRRSRVQLYAPFIALVLIQGMIMVLAPSVGEPQQLAFGQDETGDGPGATELDQQGDNGDFEVPDGEVEDGDDPDGPQVGDLGDDGTVDGQQTTGDGDGVDGQQATGGGGDDPTGNGGGDAAAAQGDTSHCTDDGRQHSVFYHAPPCEPVFEGSNGGATHPGVTADEVRVVYMYNAPHPLVDAILPTEDTPDDQRAFMEAAEDFINEHYELYGREVNLEEFRSNCPTTPPDPATCREEVRRLIDREPFMVIWPVGALYPTIFDEFARAGIIGLGGENFEPAFFNQRRPFRYSWSMDGRQMREHLGEYYCNKLARDKADRSGEKIHDEIGTRGEVDRRYGIVTPDTPSDVANANALADHIAGCERQRPAIFTYELDIERGLEQATAVVAGLISEGVTTVTCICDPVAPQFLLDEATQQDWHPEHLMVGRYSIDADIIGRIYDQDQWSRAFGPSTLTDPKPIAENDATRIWEAAGRDGDCVMCRASWPTTVHYYYPLVAHLLQAGGPNLDPGTVERGVFEYGARGGWSATGGDSTLDRRGLGENNYTWVEDVREVYWDPQAASPHDNEPGAYVAVDNGRRYQLGEWTDDLNVPMP